MIYHTKHTISIGRLSTMFDTEDFSYLKRVRIWLPFQNRKYAKFMQEYQLLFAESELKRLGNSEIRKLSYYNRILLYQSVLDLHKIGRIQDKHKEWFQSEFNKPFDVEILARRIDQYLRKMKEFERGEVQEEQKKISFEEIVQSVEDVLERPIDRNMKLFQFNSAYQRALKKIKQLEKNARH